MTYDKADLKQLIKTARERLYAPADCALAPVLRMCGDVAMHLENSDIEKWARYEREGYPDDYADLPDYRRGVILYSPFGILLGSDEANVTVVSLDENEEKKDYALPQRLGVGIREIEHKANLPKREKFVRLDKRVINNGGYALVGFYNESALNRILECVRGRMLDYFAKTEKKWNKEEEARFSQPVGMFD